MSHEGAASSHPALPLPEEISAANSDSDSDAEAGGDILEHSEHIRDAIERMVGSLGGVVGEPIEERIHSRESTSSGRGLGPEVDTQKSSASLPDAGASVADQGCSPGAELVDSLREIAARPSRRSSRCGDVLGRTSSGDLVRRGHRLSTPPLKSVATPRSASSRLAENLKASLEPHRQEDATVQRECWEQRKTALGPAAPQTLSSMSEYAATLYQLQRYEEAAELQRECWELRKTALGPAELDTLKSMSEYAATLHQLQRYEEAAELQRECWELRKTALGHAASDTLKSMSEYAASLYQLQRYEETAELQRKCWELRKTALGPAALDTVKSMSEYAATLNQLHQDEQAAELQRECSELRKTALASETLRKRDGSRIFGHRRSISDSSVASLYGHRRSMSDGSVPSMSGIGEDSNLDSARDDAEQSGPTQEEDTTPMTADRIFPSAPATPAPHRSDSRKDSEGPPTRNSSREDCIPSESSMSLSYRLPHSKCPPTVLGASRFRQPAQVAEESVDAVHEAAELNPPDMDGILWKKKSNLSKRTKVYRLLRREARKVFSQSEDFFTGLGNIELAKMYDLASEVIGLIRGGEAPMAKADSTSTESEGGSWDKRRYRLYGSELTWSKLPARLLSDWAQLSEGGSIDQSVQQVCTLRGGSVEYLGISSESQGRHVFNVYLPPEVRHRPLTFATESASDAERWITCLRKACAIPVPGPPPARPRWECTADFWHARGPPPEYEPPCAVLHLDVLCAAGLSGPEGDDASHNAYIVGCLCGHKFRTVTRYSCSGDVLFGQCFVIPVELEDPDVPVLFSVYDESAFDDQEPLLLGSIAVPLFVFGRGRQLTMVLPLRQETATRSGVVNASFGRLTIRAMLEQPTGHVFLPVEPPQPGDGSTSASDAQPMGQSQAVNLTDLETQINRIDGLLQMVVGWVTNMAFVLQWERFWWSLAWFVFLQAWTLLFWRWSLTIVALLLLKRTFDIKPRSRFGMLDDDALHIEPLSSCSGGMEERRLDRKPTIHQVSTPAETTLPPRMPSESIDMPDAIVWEAERRVIYLGFSAEYLLEGLDPPQWIDDKGRECDPPRTVVLEDGVQMRYHWQVVVNERTDENGWQYAFHFRSDAQWCCIFDTTRTWVRMRARHARRMGPIEVPAEPVLEGASNDNPDAYGSQGFLGSNVQEGTDQPQHENVISENDLFRRYKQIYLDIRDVIDFWLITLEKHKNLITWKDETVTNVITVLLVIIFVLSFVVPTRFAVAALVALAFYVGSLMGQRKRRNREIFLEGLSTWCSSNCPTQVRLRGSDWCSVVDDHGIPRLALRNWINSKYGVQLDLRSVAGCPTLRELADLVIEASCKFEKIPRRYRAWHSDVYTNFIDHVPSDATENDVGSICYKSYPSS